MVEIIKQNKAKDMINMVKLPKEIRLEDTPNLKAGFQSPIEIKNNNEEGYKTEIKGIEVFTPVTEEGFEHYWVSTKGRVWNSKSKKLLSTKSLSTPGYPVIRLRNNGDYVDTNIHRLVALAFIENTNEKPTVNHKDGDKSNNHIDNLEWSTYQENIQHAYDTGLNKRKITSKQEELILFLKKEGESYEGISETTKISESTIHRVIRKYIQENPESEDLRNRVSNRQKDFIINFRKQGMMYEKIVEKVNVSLSTVERICKEAGLVKTKTKPTEKQINEIVSLRKKGLTYNKIGETIGYSGEFVRTYLINYVNEHRNLKYLTEEVGKIKEEQIEIIISMHKIGYSNTKIAEELGVSQSTISRRLKRLKECGEIV